MVAVATVAFTVVGPVGHRAGGPKGWHGAVVVVVVVVVVTLVRKMASLKSARARVPTLARVHSFALNQPR